MPTSPWYIAWFNSIFYQKLYFERNDAEAKAFVDKLLAYLAPAPGSRMVDIACGHGRHSKMLASHGYQVTGIDLSTEAINFAKQFEKENLEFYLHDMRLPFWGNYFNYAFNFFTSFGYFRTQREHDDAFRTIVNGLQPGGIFVIDYLNVEYTASHLEPTGEKKIGDTRYTIRRSQTDTHFYKIIEITDPSIPTPELYKEEVYKFSLENFTEMMKRQGMQVQQTFGDYDLNPYKAGETPRMIIIGKKEG